MKIIYFITVLQLGLVAGLLYGYACSVNKGLNGLQDAEYIKAMQGINAAIQNPLFFISFLGLIVMLPLSMYMAHKGQTDIFKFVLASGVIYFIGVLGVTIIGNIPLNNKLASFDCNVADNLSINKMRSEFEKVWGVFHNIRTIAALASFATFIWPFIFGKKG